MKTDENDLQRENLYLSLRPLRERALQPLQDYRLHDDIAQLIVAIERVCEEDAEAIAGLEVAKILLSLGNKQDALRKVRSTLIDTKGSENR